MVIRSLLLITVSLVSFLIHDVIAFVMVPSAPLDVKEKRLDRQLKSPTTDPANKRNLALRMISDSDPDDTVRVRIWRALAASFGEELTLKQLGAEVGERRVGELRNHLKHVQKQSETLRNKNSEWKERRWLPTLDTKRTDKLRVTIRRGKKNEIYIKLA